MKSTRIVLLLIFTLLQLSVQRSTGELIRTRCEERLSCFSFDCEKISELRRCIEQAAAYVAGVASTCANFDAKCPSEATIIDRFFNSSDFFKQK